MMITTRKTIISTFLTGTMIISALPVLAEQPALKKSSSEAQSAPAYSLPGVKPAKPIVTPPDAEPENNALSTNPDGSFNIGNTRVKISGDITVDVGTGNGPNRSNK